VLFFECKNIYQQRHSPKLTFMIGSMIHDENIKVYSGLISRRDNTMQLIMKAVANKNSEVVNDIAILARCGYPNKILVMIN
jgi:hypothetical protein